MKKIFILLLFLLAAAYFLFFIFKKKEIQIVGFLYNGEHVTIISGTKMFASVQGNCISSNLCSIYEKKLFYKYFDERKLTIKLDSANKTKLDTIITLPINCEKPVISFQDPKETLPRRVVFLIDESDDKVLFP